MANSSTMPSLGNFVQSSTFSHASLPQAIPKPTEAVIPVEISLPTLKVLYPNPELTEELRRVDLDLIEELRETTAVRRASYQQKMRAHYNRTTARTPTGETPFHLTYGAEAVIPVEIGLPTLKVLYPNPELTEELRRVDLDLIEELRETTAVRRASYQQKMRAHYNRKVRPREFTVGDLVLCEATLTTKNPAKGKLAAKWKGPYVIKARI
ncbi:uncharacterized protein LOC114318261 [Camellia sinensis]|uniref:uncharacterized protein LOC114318261 n=1 Tax=Camellia sinensis TaxID=4442 RepID=UPI001035ADB8|nr:uncharacterized protein LOC114318261 [Camellia sinensis]